MFGGIGSCDDRRMIARLVNYLLTLTPAGAWLNGRKTYISAALLVVAAVLELIEKLAAIFPDYAPFALASKEVSEALSAAVETLTLIGLGGLTVGVAHKVAKKKIK